MPVYIYQFFLEGNKQLHDIFWILGDLIKCYFHGKNYSLTKGIFNRISFLYEEL